MRELLSSIELTVIFWSLLLGCQCNRAVFLVVVTTTCSRASAGSRRLLTTSTHWIGVRQLSKLVVAAHLLGNGYCRGCIGSSNATSLPFVSHNVEHPGLPRVPCILDNLCFPVIVEFWSAPSVSSCVLTQIHATRLINVPLGCHVWFALGMQQFPSIMAIAVLPPMAQIHPLTGLLCVTVVTLSLCRRRTHNSILWRAALC